MFCRNCGKELLDQAVACMGCGMNPKEGSHNCPTCGEETQEKQIICTACGGDLTVAKKAQGKSEGWTKGIYIALLFVSFFMPLFGWIYGGIQLKQAAEESPRKQQSAHYIYAGGAGFLFNLLLIALT